MISETHSSKLIGISREVNLPTDADIAKEYLGITSVPCMANSPLRDNDNNPSFSIYRWKGSIMWKDHGTGESGDIVKLLSMMWNCSYKDAVYMISRGEGTRFSLNFKRTRTSNVVFENRKEIAVKIRNWKDYDEEYWGQYGISRAMCEMCDVHPISSLFIQSYNPGTELIEMRPKHLDKYAYAYFEWKDGVESIKVYQPFSNSMKWLSSHDRSVWDLWRQMMDYKRKKDCRSLVIASSRKDAMCIWETLKMPAICMQGEGYKPKKQVMDELRSMFDNVYIWYDNDYGKSFNAGQTHAMRRIGEYPWLKNICIPSTYRSKDPSDLVMNYGKDALVEIFNSQKN